MLFVTLLLFADKVSFHILKIVIEVKDSGPPRVS